ERGLELVHVEADLLRDLLEVRALEAAGGPLRLEQLVVELPERVVALLGERLLGRLGGERGVLVEREGQVPPHDLYPVAVLLLERLQGSRDALAEGALELGELL